MNRLLDEIPPGMVLLGIPGLEQKAAARNKMHKDALKRRLRELDGRIGGGGW